MNKMKLVALSLALIGNLHAGDVFEGTVVDTLQGGGYTYLQIDDTKKKYWVAVEGTKVEKGTEVRFTEELRAKDFESKALNRKFDEIVFASNLQYRTNVPESIEINSPSNKHFISFSLYILYIASTYSFCR